MVGLENILPPIISIALGILVLYIFDKLNENKN
jgi:hypothetical protein